ncbi:hypothetical protein LCGC14_1368790 [marine sediment metagenome]|uniref:Uncharacterized protein n=1 Tax=marine sediment metagenome TaxID=412755 RepID=A0A0F9ML46_9ZZZZ
MRDPKRINRILGLLGVHWSTHPDWRLGQVIVNLCRETGSNDDPFYLEDDELERLLRLHVEGEPPRPFVLAVQQDEEDV